MSKSPNSRVNHPVYDAAVFIVAMRGGFVNRNDLPELRDGETAAELVARWNEGQA